MKLVTAIAFLLAATASASADAPCKVNSPDGELNVRDLTSDGPGKVTDVLKNGYIVTVRDFYLIKGKSWARVLDGKTKSRVIGWVFRDYLSCDFQAGAAIPPVSSNRDRPTTTGAVFLEKCDSQAETDNTFCDGLVTGVFQFLWTLQLADQPLACMVPGMRSGEVVDLAVDYIRRNEKAQDRPAMMGIVEAVVNKYGSKCPKS
jgi:hypothetical protein